MRGRIFINIEVLNQQALAWLNRTANAIQYKGNFYRVPLGTYKGSQTIVRTEITDQGRLIIYDSDNQQIASHEICTGKGKIIGGSNYKRDFSSGIDQMIDELSELFIGLSMIILVISTDPRLYYTSFHRS